MNFYNHDPDNNFIGKVLNVVFKILIDISKGEYDTKNVWNFWIWHTGSASNFIKQEQ